MVKFNLKAFRIKHGLKQVDLAKLFECGQANISAIENDADRGLEEYQIEKLISRFGGDAIAEFFVIDSADKKTDQTGEDEAQYKTKKNQTSAGDSVVLSNKVLESIISHMSEAVKHQEEMLATLRAELEKGKDNR